MTGRGPTGTPPQSPALWSNHLGAHSFLLKSQERNGRPSPASTGCVHAILAKRSTEDAEATTVVMPTGTGKTDTMLAAYCHSPKATLVMVPSDTLRTQIASSFATLGVLPVTGAIKGDFRCPAVVVLNVH